MAKKPPPADPDKAHPRDGNSVRVIDPPEIGDEHDPTTVTQLAYGRAHIDRDESEIRRLGAMLFQSPTNQEIHRIAFEELAEFDAARQDLEPAEQAARELEDKILRLRRIRPIEISQSEEIANQLHELSKGQTPAIVRISNAKAAEVRYLFLSGWLEPLLVPGGVGGRVLVAGTRTFEAVERYWGRGGFPWSGPEQSPPQRPRRKIVSAAANAGG